MKIPDCYLRERELLRPEDRAGLLLRELLRLTDPLLRLLLLLR